MTATPPLWRRLLLFFLVPAVAAVSPLLVLPVVARTAGQAGWASAIAGESIGTVASIAIGYGWVAIGPALISIAADDEHRGSLYRGSIIVRLSVAAIALPIMVVVCWLVAAPGGEWLAILMGLQGALIALSFTWFSAGIGRPGAIIFYDSVPRLVVTLASAGAIILGAPVELYPLAGVLVTLIGTGLFTVSILRRFPGHWPSRTELRQLFRTGTPVALNDVGLVAYSSVPTPLVTITSSPADAAAFASADKMLKLGQFIPMTLANALQAWITEAHGSARGRRMRLALGAHAALGVIGLLFLAVAGAWASTLLFGEEASASSTVLIALGVTFAFFSVRTSATRHVLYPAGEAGFVLRATLLSTAIGVPLMIGLTLWTGPIGAAVGYAVTEGAATILLWRRCAQAMSALHHAKPIPGIS
jgi:O-antigen/teichoic acid export membrane protein